jgi:oxygen-independent coproporphyrinogen-3 oxidase
MAGIYIHIPFCRQACTYCNFHFSTLQNNKQQVLDAIRKEMVLQQHFFPDKTVIETIYFGGGTPSLLNASEINTIMDGIHSIWEVSNAAEITLEANPDDLTQQYLHDLRRSTPVNRLSIGIQSFFEEDLRYMNRAHSAAEAICSIRDALEAGFENLSIDLIYGTPTMNDTRWEENLQAAFDLKIPHISCYALTVEDKTTLSHQIKKKKVLPPADEQTARQFSLLMDAMAAHQYTHYEISNFCIGPHFAKHNTHYWKGVPYLGLGPSAHSFDGTKRYWNISNNAVYAKKINANLDAGEFELLTSANLYNEYILTQIRTIWGVDTAVILTRFGDALLHHFRQEVSPFLLNRWIQETNGIYTLTNTGKLFCDYITANLFTQDN